MQNLASRMPPTPDRLLIGLSGGADSVALLHLLLMQPGKRLTAVHVNHGLRGEDSDGDEAFVHALCSHLQVPLLTYRAAPPPHASEDWARQVRYSFFREAMQRSGAEALTLAHHRDDQTETVLMHLLRGSGLTGLCGMRADSVSNGLHIVRPLLGFTRAELQQALKSIGQPWREDASNADARYLRNAIRTQLTPMLEQLSPGAAGRIADAALTLQADEDALQDEADRIVSPFLGLPYLPLTAVQHLSPGLSARIMRRWQQSVCGMQDEHSLSREQTAALMQLMAGKPSQQCNLPGRWRAYRGWTHLHLLPPDSNASPAPAAPVPITEDGAAMGGIRLIIAPSQGMPGNGRTMQEVPRSLLSGCVLRTWQQGDHIQPFGCKGTQSMQDYFTNRHVDAPFRRQIPLLCRGQDVLLCCGVGAGCIPAHQPHADNVQLIWQGDMPWQIIPKHPKGD